MPNARVLVLVADDNEGIRTTTSVILREEGYEVVEAVDGADALAKLSGTSFDVALLDVLMPRQDGIAVIEAVHPAPPPPAVVLVTAYGIGDDIRARLGTKVYAYLMKPVTPALLIEVVREAAGLAETVTT